MAINGAYTHSSVVASDSTPTGGEGPTNHGVNQTDNEHAAAGDKTNSLGPQSEIKVSRGPAGVSIEIDNGASRIGISKSGHITVLSSAGSGVTVTATAGPITLDAPSVYIKSKGHLNLEGASIRLASKGDIELGAPTGDITVIGRKMTQEIDGQYTITATKDYGLIVGGNYRNTIAGKTRIISTDSITIDTGDEFKVRAADELVLNSTKSLQLYSNEPIDIHSKSSLTMRAERAIDIQSTSETILMRAGQNIGLNSKANFYIRSQDLIDISSKGLLFIASEGKSTYSAKGSMDITSDGILKLSAKGNMNQFSAANINLDAKEIHMQEGIAAKVAVTEPVVVPGMGVVQAPEVAQFEQAETIQKEISSSLESPDVKVNAGSSGTGGNGVVTNSSIGRSTNPGGGTGGAHGPAAARDGVDPTLLNILDCATGKYEAATGHKVTMISGLREGDPRFHGKGMALDVSITNECGKNLGNYQNSVDDEAFAAYETFAHQMKQCQEQISPGTPFRWGGYFWNGGRGNYGAMDPMHFDIGGNSTAGGSWETGATQQQLNEWGLSSSSSQAYTGTPDYSRISKCSGQESSGGDDRHKPGGQPIDETEAGKAALQQNKTQYTLGAK